VCFRDVKQDLGGEDPQSWKRKGPERAACLSLWLHGLTWVLVPRRPPDRPNLDPPTLDPPTLVHPKATPSFLDALAALRRVLWSQQITALSNSADDDNKITEALLDTLAYAA
jgi:hypothetical protein